jgi:hypothetical protein
MPWKETRVVDERMRFIVAVQEDACLIAKVEPKCLLGDKAYDADAIRENLHARDAVAVIPPKANSQGACSFRQGALQGPLGSGVHIQLAQTGPPICHALREDPAQLRCGCRDRLRDALAANLNLPPG